MKKLLIKICYLLTIHILSSFSTPIFADQPIKSIVSTIYINEVCKFDSDLTLKKIEFQDKKTIVTLEFINTSLLHQDYAYVYVNTQEQSKSYFLEDLATSLKYYAYKTNIGLTSNNPTVLRLGEVIDIKLELPPLPSTIDAFSFAENMEGGNWGFYNLKLSNFPTTKPDLIDYYKKGALKLLMEEKYENALKIINRHIEKFPNDANGYNIAGIIHFFNRDSSQALHSFNQAIQLDKHNHAFHENMYSFKYIVYGKLIALEHLNLAVIYNPNYPPYYKIRAALHFDLEKYSDAIDDYSKLIDFERYEDELSAFYMYRGISKLWIKDDTACDDLEKALHYCKEKEDIKIINLIQQQHCKPLKRT